jgi:inosose dehydratase
MPAAEPAQPTPSDMRARLRRPDDALPNASIGTVPILWHHANPDGRAVAADPITILEEIARLGYEGTQLDDGLPEGSELRSLLARHDLGLAEVYAALPAGPTGLGPDALAIGRERLRLLVDGTGDILCVALDGTPDRDARSGRAEGDDTPRLSDAAWAELTAVLHTLADETDAAGRRLAFHPHAGTYIETPAEVQRLVATTDPAQVGICLDVGHYLVGGGDPVAALEWLGERVTHVHLKDVDPTVLARLSGGTLSGLGEAVDQRIFTELGAGMLDLMGVLRALDGRGYDGWLMVEQDSSWSPPSEAAAIGRRVLAYALAAIGAERAHAGT